MRYYFAAAVCVAVVLVSVPAFASLPYYNQELGYTIWLSDGWAEAPDVFLSGYAHLDDGVAGHMAGWEAGYTLTGSGRASLLVTQLHGRVISKASIGNFNQFVVRQLKRASHEDHSGNRPGVVCLNRASFDSRKNMLRLEMDTADRSGKKMTSVVYIVYTNGCMLKFVGLAEPGDVQSVAAIDAAVSSLYLDYGLRQ